MKQRIEELDALRGFAALAVVFFHYTLENKQAGFHFNIGCMGVDMFSCFPKCSTLSVIGDQIEQDLLLRRQF